MIRIRRDKEPEDLAKARRRHLARACLAWANGALARKGRSNDPLQAPPKIMEFDGYDVARTPLYHAQHQKCAYCERQEGLDNQPVEHFRPKAGAERDVDIDDNHYFWLAWSWENLFFTCISCNGKGTKGSQFPLFDHATKLPVPSRSLTLQWPSAHFDRKSEKPMLVDPSHEDPMGFIRWLPNNPTANWDKLRWVPAGMDPEKRGTRTITILGLDRELPDHVSANIRAHIVPKMTRLRSYWHEGDRQRAAEVWDDVEKLFDVGLPYLAATYDAIEWFLEQMGLTDLHAFIGRKLEDLRPGARDDEVPSVDLPDPPECHSLPVELVLRIRAKEWTAKEAVLAMCSHIAWDDLAVLARVLGFEESTVRNAGRECVVLGKLARTPIGGFGPPVP